MLSQPVESFVRSQARPLLRLAYLLTHDPDRAEDLVQDAMLKVLSQWDKVTAAERPEAYVRRLLVNTHISRHRLRSTTEFAVSADIISLYDRGDTSGHDAVDLSSWAMQVIRELPAQQRAVLVLRYFEDLDDNHISELLGISPSSVRSAAARAFATLRQHPELRHFAEPIRRTTAAVAGEGY